MLIRCCLDRVDLTVANHVHLVEPHWSPMAEAQAVDRVHRIGQIREVVVTRYIVRNTIENVRSPLPIRGRPKLAESEFDISTFSILRQGDAQLTINSTSNGFSRTN